MASGYSADRQAAWLDVRGDVPGTILTALDGSSFSESALAHAVSLARALGGGLHLVTVVDPLRTGATSRTSAEARLQRLEALMALERVDASLRSGGYECTFEVREGQPSVEILDAALERDIELIALAARPRSEREHLTTGSVLHGIVASGLPSLLVARGRRGRARTVARPEPTYRRIAVIVDGSRVCHRGLRIATRLARPHGAEIVLVHVMSSGSAGSAESGAGRWSGGGGAGEGRGSGIPFGETSEALRYMRVLEETVGGTGVAARSRVFRSWSDADAAHAEVDLMVVAVGGVIESARGYGPDARRLLLQAEVPVLALRERKGAAPAAPRGKQQSRSFDRRSSRRRRDWSRSRWEGQ